MGGVFFSQLVLEKSKEREVLRVPVASSINEQYENWSPGILWIKT